MACLPGCISKQAQAAEPCRLQSHPAGHPPGSALPRPHLRLKQDNPAIARLLDQPQLAANELAMRLFYFYNAPDQPLLTEQQMAALAGAAGDGQAATQEGDDWVAPVPAELKKTLNHYRDMSCLAYDYNTGWHPVAWWAAAPRPNPARHSLCAALLGLSHALPSPHPAPRGCCRA